ncbi:LAFA_0D13036g1_1 [Lachancea sp. 'fantastica']|nr:LAFA_0D13036g1_1 [Lachancea sp. 'fantastica']
MRTKFGTLFYRTYRRSSVGPKFKSLAEIKQYVATPQWSIGEFMEQDKNVQELPSLEMVERLLKLSGLPLQDAESLRSKLGHQLMFLNKLLTLDVKEDTDPKNARILPRYSRSLEFEDLDNAVKTQVQDQTLGEKSGSWESVKLAHENRDGFYVLRETLMKRK